MKFVIYLDFKSVVIFVVFINDLKVDFDCVFVEVEVVINVGVSIFVLIDCEVGV